MLVLETKKRENKTPEGFIPAVFYGKTTPSESVSISVIDFKKVWKEAGESTVVTLKTENGDHDALIHDVQFNVMSEEPTQVDFYVFEKGKKIEVEVPLVFEGKSPAVLDLGGILVKVIHDLAIEAAPQNLPHTIPVDISTLVSFDSVIMAKDLVLPEGVALSVEPEEIVASIAQPKEEEEEVVAEVDLSQIEVEKKGKKEEEEETPEKK